jgi:hypothetical protein
MEPPNKKQNNTDNNAEMAILFKPKTEEELVKLNMEMGNYCYRYTPIELDTPKELKNNPPIYDYNDPYFKTRKGLYIMADCLLSLLNKDQTKCSFYDTHTMVSTFDSNINQTIYVNFTNITSQYLLENDIRTISTNSDLDDAVAGLYDD